MSGLYNMIMNTNPAMSELMAIVSTGNDTEGGPSFDSIEELGRVRDAWITEDGKTIGVLHRNYGEEWQELNDRVAKMPMFIANCATDDYSYWWYEFSVHEKLLAVARQIAEMTDNENCFTRYQKLIDDLNDGKQNEATQYAVEAGKKIVGAILDEKDTVVEHGDGSVVVSSFQMGGEDGEASESDVT